MGYIFTKKFLRSEIDLSGDSGGSRRVSTRPPKKQSVWVKRILFGLGILVAVGFFCVGALFVYFSKDLPNPGKVNSRSVAESTKIYDRTGDHLLYEIHGEEKRTVIPFNDIPLNVKYATIALEDQDFYSHHGIKISSIFRALLKDIYKGGAAQGGSTITQQLIKNSLLTSDRTLTRKIKEVILSIEVEQKFSKNEILEMYLNEIPYGSNAYGIEAAAQTFFGKNAKELSLGEATLLASLPKAPSYYSPFGSHIDDLKSRQEFAIQTMANISLITQEDAEIAKHEDILGKIKPNIKNIFAPHFVMYVKEYLESKYGGKIVEEGGLKVYTTLDWDKQQFAEQIVREIALKNEKQYGAENAALVAIDPKTGQILTMVGSRDFFDSSVDGQVNVATRDRQPGSSFKPYVYLTAFTKGYTPETYLFDVPTNFATGKSPDYEPKNYNGKFNGPVQMKQALAMSLNVPAVKTLYLAGVKDSIMTAKSLGITTLNRPDTYGLSLVLGGGEVKLLDHTAAYATLANNGIKNEKTAILRIEDAKGNIIESYQSNGGVRVMDEKYISMLDHILSTNDYRAPIFGENNPLKFESGYVAAKTGTTNEFRDAWTMGYSKALAVGVWVGNNDNTSMKSGSDGIVVAAPIWRKFMDEALKDLGKENFLKYDPDEYKTKKDILDGKLGIEENVKVCEIPGENDSYCLANKYCPDKQTKKKDFADVHTILYYVDIKNPLGEYPKDPEDDSQYKNWEQGVKEYYKKEKGYVFSSPPKNECTSEQFSKFYPSIKITAPDSISTQSLSFSIHVEAPYGVLRIEVYINGEKIQETSNTSFDVSYTVKDNQNNSTLSLEAVIYDKNGNSQSAKKSIPVSFVPSV